MVGGLTQQHYIQANVNGRLCDAREATVSPLDRGYLYGDAVYEVWRSYQGVVFGWDEHWERLQESAQGLGFTLPFDREEAFALAKRTVAAWRERSQSEGDVYIRLQISRGSGPIGLAARYAENASYTIYVKAQPDLSQADLDRGTHLGIPRKWRRNSIHTMPPFLKTGNYLNNILGLEEALRQGAEDALFLNLDEKLTEASTRNLWLVFEDRIATPPVSDGVLAGVTRRFLLRDIVHFQGLPLVEESLSLRDLQQAKECFLSSTTQDVQPVASIDENRYPLGKDTTTRALKTVFQEVVNRYVGERQDLKL